MSAFLVSFTNQAGNSPVAVQIGREYFGRFQTRLVRLSYVTRAGWMNQATRLRLRIERLLQSSPPITASLFPYPPPLERLTHRLNQPQYDFIAKLAPKVVSPVHFAIIQRIIQSDSEEYTLENGELKLNLNNLTQESACRLFDFFMKVFPNEPVERPTIANGFTACCPKL
jgi:hypothetical protein